ncbi:MAG: glycosyl hydrolase family 17 protein [Bacteroidetes bacterium]|nr:glycosyl hydrolase family 17 protein [Bacteroidota bacterium]
MSVREEKIMALAGVDFANKTKVEIQDLFRKVLNEGTHGLCFSPYEEGQKPGNVLSENQIRRRMGIIKPYTKWVRSFSCIEGNELVPKIAKEFGIKTLVGAWLGKEVDKNEQEIAALIKLAKEGYVDIAAVGNEVLYRHDLTEIKLLDCIYKVKAAIPNVPVGYVDAYYEFSARPKITEACDVILANCYPFWECCQLEYSLMYMKTMFYQALHAGGGLKNVIISETGWPSQGEDYKGAQPSMENAMKYFINTQLWSKEEDVDIFYFTSFDESWKVGAEGDVGAFWGIWDKNENIKY